MAGGVKQHLFEVGLAARTLMGEKESGDQHVIKEFPGGVLIGVVDGLGHGDEAAHAARIAVAVLEQHASESVQSLVRRCHDALKGTRGVVMSLASVQRSGDSLSWLGVGNVEAVVVRADAAVLPQLAWLLLQGGVVGYALPSPRPATLTITEADMLVFATDGIHIGFTQVLRESRQMGTQELAERVLAQHGTGTDDALVLVARYLGGTDF